jgi:GLPGLI family protein
MNKRIVAIVVALFVAVIAYSQGLYWESGTSGGALGDRVIASQSYYMPHMFKSTTADMGNVTIVRLDKKMIYQIDSNQKTYSEMTFDEWEAQMKTMGAKMDSQTEELKKKMESMPEEQRKMMEQMMGDKMAPKSKDAKIDVVKTGEGKKIAGYSCTKYSVTKDGKEALALWATKDLKGYDTMRKDMEDFTARLMTSDVQGMKSYAEAVKKVDGFPMQTDMQGGIKVEVTKVEQKNLAVSEFEVPAGYTKVKPKMMEEKNSKE